MTETPKLNGGTTDKRFVILLIHICFHRILSLNIQIEIDGVKFKVESVMRKRRLHITGARLEDHGEYTCTTKDDKTMAQLIVERWFYILLLKFIVIKKRI